MLGDVKEIGATGFSLHSEESAQPATQRLLRTLTFRLNSYGGSA
jgi:hypothetical protein